MIDCIVETRDVEYVYPDGTRALAGVSFGAERGKKVAVLGVNGAGKSTLFLHLNGILRPSGGRVFFEGKEIRYDRRSLVDLRRQVGIVFQDPDTQIFSSSVFQEISFGPLNLGLAPSEVWQRVEEAMAATGVDQLRERPVHFLSYGQKKRVSIAGVLAMRPGVMVLDEPTAGLDPGLTLQMTELFDRINGEGVTLIASTHDVDFAYSWADYIYILRDGKVTCEGAPKQVFSDPGTVRKNGLVTPWLLSVYRELKQNGLLESGQTAPKKKEDLFRAIREAKKRNLRILRGWNNGW